VNSTTIIFLAMKLIFLILISINLISCATPKQTVFYKDGVTQRTFLQDKALCTPQNPVSSRDSMAYILVNAPAQKQQFNDCMFSLGYTIK
jgi:outer membrane protein assembly factor BamE (lipoprotein component of BamABCDE complex)